MISAGYGMAEHVTCMGKTKKLYRSDGEPEVKTRYSWRIILKLILKITIGRRGLDSLDLKIGTLGGFL
jgi:hypothetical protein